MGNRLNRDVYIRKEWILRLNFIKNYCLLFTIKIYIYIYYYQHIYIFHNYIIFILFKIMEQIKLQIKATDMDEDFIKKATEIT